MNFSFVQITDHHLTESEELLLHGYSTVRHFRLVLRHLAEHVASEADFIVTTGDLVQAGSDVEYQAVGHMLNLHTVSGAPGPQYVSFEGLHDFPMYFLPGNHDPRPTFFRHLFPYTPPAEHMNVAFVHKGVQFVCLDWGDQNKAIAFPEMFDFLARALRNDRPTVLLMHHHLVPIGCQRLDQFIADDVAKFWEIIEGHSILGIFCGHVHTTYELEIAGIPVFGLRATAFHFDLQNEAALCLYPPHYRLVTIAGDRLTTKIFEVPLELLEV